LGIGDTIRIVGHRGFSGGIPPEYLERVIEHKGHIPYVIVNPHVSPKKVVTVFFDRRANKEVK